MILFNCTGLPDSLPLSRAVLTVKVELWVGRHTKMAEALSAWSRERLDYLQVVEAVTSSADAKYHLSLLESFEKEKVGAFCLGITVCNQCIDVFHCFRDLLFFLHTNSNFYSNALAHPTGRNNGSQSQWA